MSSPLLLVLALAGAGADPHGLPIVPQPQGRPSRDVRLEDIAARLEEAGARAFPLRARALGLTPPPLEVDDEGVIEWAATLTSSGDYLRSTRFAALSADETALRDALLGRVRAERVLVRALPRVRWDPLLHVERGRDVLARVREAPAEAHPGLLDQLATVWRVAERTLGNPRRGWTEDAMEAVAVIEERLEERAAAEAGSPAAESWTEAARETARFGEWLYQATTRFGETIPRLGAQNWHELVSETSGTSLDVTSLRVGVLRELARLDTELGAERRLRPRETETDPALAVRQARAVALATQEAVSQAGLVEERDVPFETLLVVSPVLPLPQARLATRDGVHVLELVPPSEGWPLTARLTRAALFEPLPLTAQALRYGPPGEALLRALASGEGSRPFVWNRAVLEGWGLYALDWPTRIPPTSSSFAHAQLAAELVRLRMLEAARLLASMEWHALEWSEADVAEGFAARTGLDASTVHLEVRRVTRDPLLGIGFVGHLELLALEDALAGEPAESVRRALALVAADPRLRPADLRRRLEAE